MDSDKLGATITMFDGTHHRFPEEAQETYQAKTAGTLKAEAKDEIKALLSFKLCKFCQKPGHLEEDCWTNPKSEKFKGGRPENRNCELCGRPGHVIRKCRLIDELRAKGLVPQKQWKLPQGEKFVSLAL
jgi:hypothetical protein